MDRKVTDLVIDRIRQWEGLRLTAYRDAGGVWTIGYGHTGAEARAGRTITREQAEALLRRDLARFEAAVEKAVGVPLSDNQFGALVSFAFNVGEAAFAGSTLVKLLNGGDYNSVPAQLARWVHAGGRRVQGLVNRRAAEAGLWAAGAFVSSAPVAASVPPQGLLTAESATATAGVLSAVATAASTPGPLQWLFMAILVASYGFSALSWWSRRREQAR
ncbi:lysozyme [Pseudochelatococcus lubricantis]|uniref:Lysozyme n=1 Tax=Pseudochelatococcus lubricantis TaxID=1538102 RepID=A0ABX0V3X5_9HYPH|nr:lysozyme [Pseudochelatococcus lubricantis]NIJ57771.1 lysozyme [Pseudochelatococcus lubricantis]